MVSVLWLRRTDIVPLVLLLATRMSGRRSPLTAARVTDRGFELAAKERGGSNWRLGPPSKTRTRPPLPLVVATMSGRASALMLPTTAEVIAVDVTRVDCAV